MLNQVNPTQWNALIASLSEAHILQTRQWAAIKAQIGWQPSYYCWGAPETPQAAALLLQRTIKLGGFGPRLRVLYLPKGPLLQDWGDLALRQMVLDDLTVMARQRGAIFFKMDPDIPLGRGLPPDDAAPVSAGQVDPIGTAVLEDLTARGFRFSDEQIQFRNTMLLNLHLTENELLAQMKQKTRYNIRLAGRKGVTVRPGTLDDLPLLYRMYAETSLRDGFAIRGEAYYLNLWQTFLPDPQSDILPAQPGCRPLIAEVEGQPVAAVVIFYFARRAYYLHGMSTTLHRKKMPNYLLQWEAIRFAQSLGCQVYDLWGAPDVFDPSDSLWGVYRFKKGLGAQELRTIGAYDLSLRPNYYRLYTQVLPRLLAFMRRRGRTSTQTAVNG
jgi:lipid II:glycine glycyltransferase (peptidoglycan interpeptide bridge formation enzyme)